METPSMGRALLWTLIAGVAIAVGSVLPLIGVDGTALAEATGQGEAALPMFSMVGQAPATLVIVQSVLLIGGWQDRAVARKIAFVVYLALVAVGALGIAMWLESLELFMPVVDEPGWQFRITTTLAMVAFAAILWWIGDRISSSSAAHGALAIALVLGLIRAPFEAWSAFEAFARGSASLWVAFGALLPALVVLALGVIVFVRPAAWPLAITKRFALRSWIDLAGTPLALRVLLTQPLSTSLAAVAASGQGLSVVDLLLPAGLIAVTVALAAFYLKKAERGAEKSASLLTVGGIVALVALGAAVLSFGKSDGFAMFEPGPLAGENSFRFTLGAAEGHFGSNEAEAMVERIRALGAEAEIVSESRERITLAVHAASERDAVLDAIRPHALELRLVAPPPDLVALPPGAERSYDGTIEGTCAVVEDLAPTLGCPTALERQSDEEGAARCLVHCLENEVVLDGDGVEEARVEIDPSYGHPTVMVTLTDEATERFAAVTGANIHRKLAILVDGEVMSAPVIQTAIPNGTVQITMGSARSFDETLREANILATALSASEDLHTPWVLESEG